MTTDFWSLDHLGDMANEGTLGDWGDLGGLGD